MGGGIRIPNAGDVAIAIVTAARLVGVAPDVVFQRRHMGGGKARVAAAAGLTKAGFDRSASARVCNISPTNLAPSQLVARRIPDHWLAVIAAAVRGSPDPLEEGAAAPAGTFREPPAAAPAPKPTKAARQGERRSPLAAPKAPAKAAAPRAARRPARPAVSRLKPVTDRIAGWSWWFVAAGWSLDVTAWLFDVDADELGEALQARDEHAALAGGFA